MTWPLKDDDRPISDNLRKYSWQCPRLGCKKYILAYTDTGLQSLKNLHLDDHAKDDREMMIQFQEGLKNTPIRDYDKLILTFEDINFLVTRGISIDEQIEYDSKLKRRVCTDERQPRNWHKILERI